ELEALRKENELLKLNLQVVLEKVRAQEAEVRGLRKELAGRDGKLKDLSMGAVVADYDNDGVVDLLVGNRLYRNKGDGRFDVQPFPGDDAPGAVKEAERPR